MKRARIAFSNPDSEQSVVIDVEFNEASSTVSMNMEFEPAVGNETPTEFHTNLALAFMRYMQSRGEIEA